MPKLRLCIHGNRDTLPILMQRLRAAGLARPAADDLPGYHDLPRALLSGQPRPEGIELRFRPPSWSSVRPSERQELMREQGRATDRRGTREQGPVY